MGNLVLLKDNFSLEVMEIGTEYYLKFGKGKHGVVSPDTRHAKGRRGPAEAVGEVVGGQLGAVMDATGRAIRQVFSQL
ncbi:hypothetical protein HZA41_01230 [Candidatus Peregrinibacteria bacterium]|nr:hypothetical protein [Candidatus Peregrinibacteria bacterium]